jgi:hypothetical protein
MSQSSGVCKAKQLSLTGMMGVTVQLFDVRVDAAYEFVFGLKFRELSLQEYRRSSNVLIVGTGLFISHDYQI